MADTIPDKPRFRIGEVARIAGVKPHVLRYWESEFGVLRPGKSRSGQRIYRRHDVALVLEIKRLLYEHRFTIEGARKWLARRPKRNTAQMQLQLKDGGVGRVIEDVKKELRSILALLEDGRFGKGASRADKKRGKGRRSARLSAG